MLCHVEIARSMGRRPQTITSRVARARPVTSFPLPSGAWSHDGVVRAGVSGRKPGCLDQGVSHQMRTDTLFPMK